MPSELIMAEHNTPPFPLDMSNLTALVVSLRKLSAWDPDMLILVNDFMNLFGFSGPKWRQKCSILSVLKACSLPYQVLEGERISDFDGKNSVVIGEITYNMICPRLMSKNKTKPEKLFFMKSTDIQKLAFCCRKKESMDLIDIVVNLVNSDYNNLHVDMIKGQIASDILMEAIGESGVFL